MIDIEYMNSKNNSPLCFNLHFLFKDYIPKNYFQINKDGAEAELYFYIDLLKENKMFDAKESNCHQLIWSYHYDCHCQEIPFTMVYDEDYDFVSFSVSNENVRTQVAEKIRDLVESQKQ